MINFFRQVLRLLRNPPDPNWHLERKAKPTSKHPLAGFWKRKKYHTHGLAIGPERNGQYYISFCGPGGCTPKGQFLPSTKINNDPNFEVVSENELNIKISDRMISYTRAASRSDA